MDNYPKVKKTYFLYLNRIEDYKLIKKLYEEEHWSISFMCKELNIKRSAYYKWLSSPPSKRQIEDEAILKIIKETAESNNSLFGAMNMYYYLRNNNKIICGHNRIYRLMAINDIHSSFRRTAKYNYHRSIPEVTAENLLKRDFDAEKPNEKWCTDVTEIRVPKTGEKLFISPALDLFDRYPVSLQVSERNDTKLTDDVLEEAHNKYPDATPLWHDDRGFQYTRKVYQDKLKEYGYTQSMSRVSRCIDNGPCEQFQGLFKDILFILYPNISSKEEMIQAIYGTLDYYINKYPQKRFKGKTSGQVRQEVMTAINNNGEIINYPIKQAKRYTEFWVEIEAKKQKALQQV